MRKRKGGAVQSRVSNQWQQIRIGQQNWSWAFFYHSSKSVRILFKNECSSDLGRRAQSLGTGPRNLHFNKPLPDAHTQQVPAVSCLPCFLCFESPSRLVRLSHFTAAGSRGPRPFPALQFQPEAGAGGGTAVPPRSAVPGHAEPPGPVHLHR